MLDTHKKTEIVFISGAHGSLGHRLMEEMGKDNARVCFGLQRDTSAPQVSSDGRTEYWPCDIADFSRTAELIKNLLAAKAAEGCNIAKITLIHAVGPFKYEGYTNEHDAKGIDPFILKMNYEAFKNMGDAILDAARKMPAPIQVNLCTFGSVSEDYHIPLWYSFNQAKAEARHYIESKVSEHGSDSALRVSGLYFRTSTIDTGKENKLRPLATADVKRYWLNPEKIAAGVCAHLDRLVPGIFETEDAIKPIPGFSPETYYKNLKKLDKTWRKMMPPK